MVKDYRKKVGSKTGGIKLYSELKQDFINADIKMGRDKFYRFLRLNNLLVPKRKNYITTTNSNHMYKKYRNLVKDHVPNRPEQLWVSDIIYIKTAFAETNGITMSMTEQYDPYENAVAERVNQTLKYEYGLKRTIKDTALVKKMTWEAVYIYNNLRTHFYLELIEPAEYHLNSNINYRTYRKNNVNLSEITI